MAGPEVKILLTAVDKASKVFKDVGKSTEDVKSGTDKMKGAFTALGVTIGVVAAAGVALKAALDMGREGAAAIQTGESFDFLMKKVGAAPGLLDQLREASKGTITDLDLMSSTSTLLAGAQGELAESLINSTPQLMAIAKAANKLNPALGTTQHQYESLALGIKRASPMILDNLGLTIKVGEANEAYAKALGKTVEELTAEEQKQALLNDVLRAGGVLIDQVGGSTDSATDSYDQMTVAVEEATLSLKMKLAPAMGVVAREITRMLTAQDDLDDALKDTTGTYEEYEAALRSSIPPINSQQAAVLAQKIAHEKLTEEQFYAIQRSNELAEAMEGAEMRGRGYTSAVVEAADKTADLKDETDLLKEAQDALKQKMGELQLFMAGPIKKENEAFEKKQEDIRLKMSEVAGQIDVLNGKKHKTKEQKAQLDELKQDYIDLQADYTASADAHDEASKRILFNILQQAAAVDGLSETEGDALAAIALNWGLVDTATWGAYNIAQDFMNSLQDGIPPTIEQVKELNRQIQAIEDKEVLIKIRTVSSGGKFGPGLGGQHGLDFTVPAGFPNDTFGPIYATSGERVSIQTPAQQTNTSSAHLTSGVPALMQGSGGVPAIINIYPLPGQDENAIAARVLQMLRGGNNTIRAGAGYAGT